MYMYVRRKALPRHRRCSGLSEPSLNAGVFSIVTSFELIEYAHVLQAVNVLMRCVIAHARLSPLYVSYKSSGEM